MPELSMFKFEAAPDKGFDAKIILEQISGNAFMLLYDFYSHSTMLYIDCENSADKINSITSIINGIEFSNIVKEISLQNIEVSMFYKSVQSIGFGIFSDIFNINIQSGFFAIVFIPIPLSNLSKTKSEMERMLSSVPSRFNATWRGFLPSGRGDSTSFQHEVFDKSEESLILKEALEQINFSIMNNGLSYKVALLDSVEKDYKSKISEYISSKVLILKKYTIKQATIKQIITDIASTDTIPFGNAFSSMLIKPYGDYEIRYPISSKPSFADSGIKIGSVKYWSPGDFRDIRMQKSLFNLGMIISGLPGTGKTSEAMGIVSQISKQEEKPYIAVIAPTKEWSDFGRERGMKVIEICNDGLPINFFSPPDGVDIKRFYQDLSILLASASESGPYQKPLEKCLINAFRRYYSLNSVINPVSLFKEIQESITELHGIRSNTGVKYTKHGENIKSSLESLIEILQFPEYSAAGKNNIEGFLKDGIIFDVSAVSVQMKSFFYALILNQLYSIASKFDIKGDKKLRMLICIEEAQLLFRDPKSATVVDIRSRIQDFRKIGIGLMLLVHSITDIDQDIRRLCQSKLYLKQPTDVAKKAAEDLIFSGTDEEDVVNKLKHMESGYAALNYVVEKNGIKINPDTIFVKTIGYGELGIPNYYTGEVKQSNAIDMHKVKSKEKLTCVSTIKISFKEQKKLPAYVRLCYLGAFTLEVPITSNEVEFKHELIKSRMYSLELLNEHRKKLKSIEFESGREIKLEL